MPKYVKRVTKRFYKIKNDKSLRTRIKDKLGKIIDIDTKSAADLMDRVSKNKNTYDKVKSIFNDDIRKSANTNSNRTKLLKIFLI